MADKALTRFIHGVKHPLVLNTLPRVDYIISRTQAQSYLEIGVNKGGTFYNVQLPYKVGVDPEFRFDWKKYHSGGCLLFETTSDEFFADLAANGPRTRAMKKVWPRPDLAFDLIFIDGLHTFAQSFRDFENSLRYAHRQTVWIIDDTVPSNPYSAWPDMEFSLKLRRLSGLNLMDWHGDVYKTLFAIHDKYPEFSYCTLMGHNPQTVLWRNGPGKRKPVFSSLEEIDRLTYFDMFKYAELFIPVPDEEFPLLLGKELLPADYKSDTLWERLVYMDIGQQMPKEYLHLLDKKKPEA